MKCKTIRSCDRPKSAWQPWEMWIFISRKRWDSWHLMWPFENYWWHPERKEINFPHQKFLKNNCHWLPCHLPLGTPGFLLRNANKHTKQRNAVKKGMISENGLKHFCLLAHFLTWARGRSPACPSSCSGTGVWHASALLSPPHAPGTCTNHTCNGIKYRQFMEK